MIQFLLNEQNFIPNEYHKTIYEIDFNKLYESGCRLILTDLDNTIIPYDVAKPDTVISNLFAELKQIGYEIIIVSNNHKKRVMEFSNELGVDFVANARKPLKYGMNKSIKKATIKYSKNQILVIGDQLMTDVYVAKRMKLYVVLVDAIKRKTEKWYTKLNRKLEGKMLKKIKRKSLVKYTELNLAEKR